MQPWVNEILEATAEGEIVGKAANVKIISCVESGGGEVITGTNDAIMNKYDIVGDVDEVGISGGVVVTIQQLLPALCKTCIR